MAERENCGFLLHVPDAVCEKYGCQSAWGFGNHLYVYGKSDPTNESREAGNIHVKVHEVRWETDMHGPVPRKLVNEAHDIFMKLQQNTSDGKTKQTSMVKFSREYRSVLRACIIDLQNAVEMSNGGDEATELEEQIKLYEIIELIWSLCEILFVDTLPGGLVLLQLLDWVRMHFVEGFRIAHDCMRLENPEDHSQYWDAITILVLQGSIEEARRLLSAHTDQTPSFSIMDQMLKTMPIFTSFPGHSLAEFEMKWRHWQDECHQRLTSGEFLSHANLQTIARILCGEDEVFKEQRCLLSTWYCMLFCRLLYQNPGIKTFDLQYNTQFCIDCYGGHSMLQPWDSVILSVLEFDVHQVIKENSAPFSNWWFVAHLTDLLHHCGKLESQTLHQGSNLREFLLLEYANALISHHSLWQVAADYLDQCPQNGRYYLEQYIEKLPLGTERKANKIIRLCEARNMQDQVKSICKVMGMKSLHNNRLGSALSWGLRAKDAAFVTVLAEIFLDRYSETGDFSNIELIDNLGASMLLSGKLTFLGKYREFHRLYENEDFHAAASLLLSLLTARVAPKKFWLIMLTDALPLLETKQVIFSSEETYLLMNCLEELRMAQRLIVHDKQEVTELEKEKLELLKLAMARNLARAVVHEGTQTT